MRTLVISDLHLGAAAGVDVLRRAEPRAALIDALGDVERLVLLGDVLELRHGPRRDALAAARPFFEELGEAFAGREVVVVAGNHDHALVESWLRRRDESPTPEPLALEQRFPAEEASSMLATLASWAAPARLTAAYPGLWLRPDVYATHGHYLDCHLTIPTMERLGIGMTARALRRPTDAFATVGDYEAVTGPVFAWIDAVARQAPTGATLNGQSTVRVWRTLAGNTRTGASASKSAKAEADGSGVGVRDGLAALAALAPEMRRRLLTGAFPVAIAALNRFGLGSFNADISTAELRRAGLRAMGEVASRLGLGDAHVIFGHTHRAGPLAACPSGMPSGVLPRDIEAEWRGPGGARLINSGCWTYDSYFVTDTPGESPYWPGGSVLVDDEGPPTPPILRRLLDDRGAQELKPIQV
jgi:Calcineurin-like phosphoesterase superfamily domain